jgi:hypothetical protein
LTEDMSDRPIGTPILALCGCGPGSENRRRVSGWSFPARGRLTLRASDDETGGRRGVRGLSWGVGDPAAADLDSPHWAIVRLDEEDTPIEAPGTVELFGGTVIYRGDPRGALETLIQHGADRAAMAVQLVMQDENGIADVGAFGVAVTGDCGLARGGPGSHLLVPGGYNGIAVAGRGGRATVGGSNGIAVVDAEGHAMASGLAVGRGAGGTLVAREPGVAVALAAAQMLEVEAGGIAVGLDRVQRITIGSQAVAVVRHATGSRVRVTLGEGALIVVRYFEPGHATPRFSIAQAGAGGLQPDVPYIWVDGTFHLKSEYVAPDGETSTWASSAPEKEESPAPPNAPAPPGDILWSDTGDMMIVLDDGWAISEGGGVAVAGTGGLARSAAAAQAGDGGIAITDGGKAAAGARGVAVCDDKRYGTAEAGEGGVAVGLGSRYGMISAGAGGAALYGGAFGIVTAGDDGVAIGGFESNVRVGADGVAIASGKCPLGGPGSLLVCRDRDGNFRSTVVAEDGEIEPEFLLWAMQFERRPEEPLSP